MKKINHRELESLQLQGGFDLEDYAVRYRETRDYSYDGERELSLATAPYRAARDGYWSIALGTRSGLLASVATPTPFQNGEVSTTTIPIAAGLFGNIDNSPEASEESQENSSNPISPAILVAAIGALLLLR